MSCVIKNIFSNYIGTGLVGVINLVSLSLLAKVYGLESWGMIAACIALMNLIGLAELGMSQIYVSEFNKTNQGSSIFRSFQCAIALAGLFGCFLTGLIFWLLGKYFLQREVVYSDFYVMALAMSWAFLSIINNFYYTKLVAAEEQVRQNIQWVISTFLKNSMALFVGLFISTKPSSYLFAVIFATLLEIAYNEIRIRNDHLEWFDFDKIKSVHTRTGLLSISIAIGTAVFFCDRVILPLLISSYEFGVYAIVTTLGLYFLQLQYPIVKGLFPLVAKMHHSNNSNKTMLSGSGAQLMLIGTVMVPPLILIGCFSRTILSWYSVPDELLYSGQMLFSGVLVAVFFNALYNVFYINLVVKNNAIEIMIINILGLLFSVVILMTLGATQPFVAGAASWVAISIIQLIGGYLSHCRASANYGTS